MNNINFAEIHTATARRKTEILLMDHADPRNLSNVASAIACLRKYVVNGETLEIIENGISELENRECSTWKSLISNNSSIGVLKAFAKMRIQRPLFPEAIFEISCKRQPFFIQDLRISVSPKVVFYVERPDGLHAGGFVFRTTKSGSFGVENCRIASLLLEKHLTNALFSTFYTVDKDLCFCVDPINNCWASSPHDEAPYNAIIEDTYRMITQQDNQAA